MIMSNPAGMQLAECNISVYYNVLDVLNKEKRNEMVTEQQVWRIEILLKLWIDQINYPMSFIIIFLHSWWMKRCFKFVFIMEIKCNICTRK